MRERNLLLALILFLSLYANGQTATSDSAHRFAKDDAPAGWDRGSKVD
jgi:hypothetical protein